MNDYQKELNNNGVLAFTPNGNSMWPFLKNGKNTVIIVKREQKAQKYDVVFYFNKGIYVLHRVIEVTETGYITTGDSLLKKEEVAEEKVFGVMAGFYRGKTYIEANDRKYLEKVKKFYSDEQKRKKKIDGFYLREKLKSMFKGV